MMNRRRPLSSHFIPRCAVAVVLILAAQVLAQDRPGNTLHYMDSDYGRAMDARGGGVVIDAVPEFGRPPLTIQARVKILRRNFFFDYVIACAGRPEEPPAWELSLQERKGIVFSIHDSAPQEITIPRDILDSKWHDLTIRVAEQQVEVSVDGDLLQASRLTRALKTGSVTKMWIGQSSDGSRGCEGLIDDLRISSGLQPVRNAWSRDENTLVYLDFEESESEFLAQWTPLPSTRPGSDSWERESDADWMDDRFQSMDRGPYFANSTELRGRRIGSKNISIQLDHRVQVMFDSLRCVTVAGLVDAGIAIPPNRFGILRQPEMSGKETFYVDAARAWQHIASDSGVLRPLNDEDVRYGGLYLHENDVVLKYRVAKTEFLEGNSAANMETGGTVFSRRWMLEPPSGSSHLALAVFESSGDPWLENDEEVVYQQGDEIVVVRVDDAPSGARLRRQGRRVFIQFPTVRKQCGLFLWKGDKAHLEGFRQYCATQTSRRDLAKLIGGSERRWGEPLITQGKLGATGSPYVIDDITMPLDNPYGALMFATGLDFFSSGTTAAVCMVHGDVWLVSGIDAELDEIRWQRFATGLYQPLGLKIVDNVVHVLGRDQITRLHDLNDDGEADFYENFNNDLVITGQSHAYAMCLETDPDGNFYFLKSGRTPPHGGSLLKLARDGSHLSVFATGYRHPNGLGVGPDGTVTAADNQGNWIPTSSIQIVEPGSFHGYMPELHRPQTPYQFDQPLCWIPHSVDNSSGGQVWCNSNRWGPFDGDLLHLSWGRCTLHLVMREMAGGRWQGGTVTFPDVRFASGPARARFNRHDGQLYVCGLDGWQTAAPRDGCFQRVRYTGEPVLFPKSIRAHENGIRLSFTQPLDKSASVNPKNFEVSQWQYQWTQEYGSSEFSIVDPERIGHDAIRVDNVSVSEDGRTAFLHIPTIRPVMQMQIHAQVRAANGQSQTFDIYNTIHHLGDAYQP